MMVEIVAFLVKMFVKHEAGRACHVIPVGIEPKMGRRFGLPHVLFFSAFDAVSQIDTVFAFAIEVVADFKALSGLVAFEGLRRSNLAAAFVLRGR